MAHVLMIVTSADRMPNGEPTGLWLEEFAIPYALLRDAGHAITVASPRGGATPIDPRSAEDETPAEWEDAAARLRETEALEGLQADSFVAEASSPLTAFLNE